METIQKIAKYEELLLKSEAIISPKLNTEGNILNIISLIKSQMDFFWCGIYKRTSEDELQLSYFQGLPACTHIKIGKGVCGTAASTQKVQIVDDVNQFPGYIACHHETQSEIVIPFVKNSETIFVLDVDSIEIGNFDEVDSLYLNKLVNIISLL